MTRTNKVTLAQRGQGNRTPNLSNHYPHPRGRHPRGVFTDVPSRLDAGCRRLCLRLRIDTWGVLPIGGRRAIAVVIRWGYCSPDAALPSSLISCRVTPSSSSSFTGT